MRHGDRSVKGLNIVQVFEITDSSVTICYPNQLKISDCSCGVSAAFFRDSLTLFILSLYYPPEVSSIRIAVWEYLGRNTAGSSLHSANSKNILKYWYSWVVKVKDSGHNTPLGHHTDCSPMGLGQYNSLGKYCDPHTASSVFLILIPTCK